MGDWIDAFPGLARLDTELRRHLVERSRLVDVPKGTVIFGPGKAPENLLLLLSGVVRVQQIADSGREIVLYRVHAHESCVLTTACLLAYEEYRAEGIAESDVSAAAVPKSVFEEMIAQSGVFRRFVFSAYSRRITDLCVVIEEVAFRRLDIRLAETLLELVDASGEVHRTHSQLATELGTAREVVSRQLQEFQRRGWVAASRGRVRLSDASALRDLTRAL